MHVDEGQDDLQAQRSWTKDSDMTMWISKDVPLSGLVKMEVKSQSANFDHGTVGFRPQVTRVNRRNRGGLGTVEPPRLCIITENTMRMLLSSFCLLGACRPLLCRQSSVQDTKVGDWTEYKVSSTTAGSPLDFTKKYSVAAKDDMVVTLKTSLVFGKMEVPGPEIKIN